MSHLIAGLTGQENIARNAVGKLHEGGVDDLWVLADGSPDREIESFQDLKLINNPNAGKTVSRAIKGAAIGGVASASAIAVPFVGPFVFALSAPTMVAAGALAGAALGGAETSPTANSESTEDVLRNLGFSEIEIPRYARGVSAGRFLVVAGCGDQEVDRIENLLISAGLEDIAALPRVRA